MDFHIIEAVDAFKQAVVTNFICSYEQGLTPNPCVQCNRHIKFSFLLDRALELGYDTVVTGHYAKIRQVPDTGRYLLYKAADSAKDQSYFLAGLTQQQLAHIQFPLGELTKEQARQIAQDQGFENAKKQDSQDICFIPDGKYVDFIKRYTGKEYPSGDFVTRDGKILGKHKGIISYTIGQKKGLGLVVDPPLFVCGIDPEKNTVTLCESEGLFSDTLIADDVNFISIDELDAPMKVLAKIRYRHKEQPAIAYPLSGGRIKVVFKEPQRAITKGQSVVLYDRERPEVVVGGGKITEV
jgi:tRNA-specific 2-thiouridylase